MEPFDTIKMLLTNILDIREADITPETYIIRDLGAESIDLLELAVALNTAFKIEVIDHEIFLTRLREYITEAEEGGLDMTPHLKQKLPFLSHGRIREIMADLENGPTLKVKDLVGYIEHAGSRKAGKPGG